ncbi:MAG: hypothetical protein AAGU74_06760 [Bacillota bacterium]
MERMNERLTVPQLILIGAHGRNSGKTLLACDIIEAYGARFPIYALKIIGIDRPGQECHRGKDGCGMCTRLTGAFELIEEGGSAAEKDTARMLQAGAKRAYLLKSLKTCMFDAFADFLGRVPRDALIVCESNTLRKEVRPGVFLFAASKDGRMKPSARDVAGCADVTLAPGDTAAARRIRIIKNRHGSLSAVAARTEPDGREALPRPIIDNATLGAQKWQTDNRLN